MEMFVKGDMLWDASVLTVLWVFGECVTLAGQTQLYICRSTNQPTNQPTYLLTYYETHFSIVLTMSASFKQLFGRHALSRL